MEIKQVALPLSWLGLGGQRPHLPPPTPQSSLTGWEGGQLRREEQSSIETLMQTDVDVPPCPWNLVLLDLLALQLRNGCVRSPLVRRDRAAIAVVINTATHPTIRNSVWEEASHNKIKICSIVKGTAELVTH